MTDSNKLDNSTNPQLSTPSGFKVQSKYLALWGNPIPYFHTFSILRPESRDGKPGIM
jgi:hypothetical protein